MFALLSRFEIAVTIGVLGAIALVQIARSLAPRRELLVYGAGFGITAVAYVVFGLQRGAPASHLGLELGISPLSGAIVPIRAGAILSGQHYATSFRRPWPIMPSANGWRLHCGNTLKVYE